MPRISPPKERVDSMAAMVSLNQTKLNMLVPLLLIPFFSHCTAADARKRRTLSAQVASCVLSRIASETTQDDEEPAKAQTA